VGSPFPLLKCLKPPKIHKDFACTISRFSGDNPGPPQKRPRCFGPDTNFRLARQRSRCSRFTKRPLVCSACLKLRIAVVFAKKRTRKLSARSAGPILQQRIKTSNNHWSTATLRMRRLIKRLKSRHCDKRLPEQRTQLVYIALVRVGHQYQPMSYPDGGVGVQLPPPHRIFIFFLVCMYKNSVLALTTAPPPLNPKFSTGKRRKLYSV